MVPRSGLHVSRVLIYILTRCRVLVAPRSGLHVSRVLIYIYISRCRVLVAPRSGLHVPRVLISIYLGAGYWWCLVLVSMYPGF